MASLASTFDLVGDLVSAVGAREFGGVFYELVRDVLQVDECTAFAFVKSAQPEKVLVEGNDERARTTAMSLASDYVSDGYRRDPNVRMRGSELVVYATDAASIKDSSYRAHYYTGPALTHELVVLGNVGDSLYYTSLYRRDSDKAFKLGEVSKAETLAGFLIKALHRHQQLTRHTGSALVAAGDPRIAREEMAAHFQEVLRSGPYKLSPREAEICARIVLGYSALAISLNTGISPNTVATHRKRAYAKLGISSQNELFARYFSVVRELQTSPSH